MQRYSAIGRTSLVVTLVGCGPVVGAEDSSGTGDGGGSSSAESSDGGTDTEVGTDCELVLSTDPSGAAAPSVFDGQVYWSTLSGTINRSPLDDAAPETVLTTSGAGVDLSLTSDSVVFTVEDRVEQFDVLSGQSVVLAAGQNNPTRAFRLGSSTYWINAGSGILAGRLMRLEQGESEPIEVMDGFGFPVGADVDEEAYYFVAKDFPLDGVVLGAVIRVDAETDDTMIIAAPLYEPSGLAVTEDRVVWLERSDATFGPSGRVRSVAKTGGAVTDHATIDEGVAVMVAADTQGIAYSVFNTDATRVHGIDLSTGDHSLFAELPGSTVVDIALAPDAMVLATSWSDGGASPGTPSITRLCRE